MTYPIVPAPEHTFIQWRSTRDSYNPVCEFDFYEEDIEPDEGCRLVIRMVQSHRHISRVHEAMYSGCQMTTRILYEFAMGFPTSTHAAAFDPNIVALGWDFHSDRPTLKLYARGIK